MKRLEIDKKEKSNRIDYFKNKQEQQKEWIKIHVNSPTIEFSGQAVGHSLWSQFIELFDNLRNEGVLVERPGEGLSFDQILQQKIQL